MLCAVHPGDRQCRDLPPRSRGARRSHHGDPGRAAGQQPGGPRGARERWGLDKPLPIQYVYYVANLLRGDWGESISTARRWRGGPSRACSGDVRALPSTPCLRGCCRGPLGIVSALNHDRWPDHVARFVATHRDLDPGVLARAALLYVFFYRLEWLPGQAASMLEWRPRQRSPAWSQSTPRFPAIGMSSSGPEPLVLPSIVLGSFAMGILARMLRSSLLASLGDDYVRTARAKGLGERSVVVGHALRNALIPTVTVLGLTDRRTARRRGSDRDDLLLARRR